MKKKKSLLLILILFCAFSLTAQQLPKREFRGAWIQAVNGQFQGLKREAMQANLTRQLNALKACGVNTIIFQVRVEGDALYNSPYEPWSRYLTGRQGVAPSPYWDPLAWMVEQCHLRGMELHAWINPFRAKTKGTSALAANHPAKLNPDRCFPYDGLLIFDPGKAENRHYICQVAADIVRRYDIDGFHIDDYFYPYPNGTPIPDDATFAAYGNGYRDRGDWRRYNVNLFVSELHDTIRAIKPWVKFGISPFGIYHNATNSALPGSATKGLQNYDDLYADVLYWVNQGWVDYIVPQLYWEIGHKTADYATLIKWWSKYGSKRPLVIGQDVERTVRAADLEQPTINQQPAKFALQRSLPCVVGSCLWYSAVVVDNVGNYATALRTTYHKYPALSPDYSFMYKKAPKKPKRLKALWMPDGYYLFWSTSSTNDEMNKATRYVIYRFEKGQERDLDNPANIVAITSDPLYRLPYDGGQHKYVYVVTALNRIQNESKPAKKSVKL